MGDKYQPQYRGDRFTAHGNTAVMGSFAGIIAGEICLSLC